MAENILSKQPVYKTWALEFMAELGQYKNGLVDRDEFTQRVSAVMFKMVESLDSETFSNALNLFHPKHMSRENPEFASMLRQAQVRDHSLSSDFFLKVYTVLLKLKINL